MRTLNFSFLILLLLPLSTVADEASSHIDNIDQFKKRIYKYEQELNIQIEKKKTLRDRARVEETLQRIVEIHAELIAIRQSLNTEEKHLRLDHPQLASEHEKEGGSKLSKVDRKKYQLSPVDRKLDKLLEKIQSKYASYIVKEEEKKKAAVKEFEGVVRQKKKEKKQRDSDTYLRRKSKVRLSE